jgi:hypothetical protein
LYSKVEGQVPTTIYGYDVELGYMTNNIPNIQSITSATTASGVQLNVVFGNNLEKDLFNTAVFSVNRAADDVDISDSFVDKDSWILSTTTRRGIHLLRIHSSYD